MRLIIFLSFLMSVLTLNSCGSSNGGGGSPDDGSGQGPSGRPLTDAECADAWKSYVSAHPLGLKMRYEQRGMGSTTTYTIEVTDSRSDAVSESTVSGNQTNISTITKPEFMESCTSSQGRIEEPSGVTIEARRKETKTVRAGTFSTNYLKTRMTQNSGGNSAVVVSEVWTNDAPSLPFLVYSKSVSTMGSYSFESSIELLSLIQP